MRHIAIVLLVACGSDATELAVNCDIATTKDEGTACSISSEGLSLGATGCAFVYENGNGTDGQCLAKGDPMLIKSSYYLNGKRGVVVEVDPPTFMGCVFRECE